MSNLTPLGGAFGLGLEPATIENPSLRQMVQHAIPVLVIYARSPREIYIRPTGVEDRYLKLCAKLRALPKDKPRRPIHSGHYVTQVEQEWRRARILSFERNRTCRVFLVDYGKIVRVQRSDLYNLPPHLCREQSCVIKCAVLYSAQELNDRSQEVFDGLKQMMHTRPIVLFYHVLTAPHGGTVNGDLLLHDWFINMVVSVRQLFLNHYDPRNAQDASALVRLVNCSYTTYSEHFFQQTITNMLEDVDGRDSFYLITYAESLDSIYCFPLTLLKFRLLMDNILVHFYEDETPLPTAMVVTGMKCVIRHSHKLYRGVVQSMHGNICRVYAKDIGRTYQVPKDAVWQQFPILEMGAMCIRCSMDGITPPPGGSWPAEFSSVLPGSLQEGQVVRLFKHESDGGQNRVLLSLDCSFGSRVVNDLKNMGCTVRCVQCTASGGLEIVDS